METRFCEYSVCDSLYEHATELRNRMLRIPLGLDLLTEDRSSEKFDRHFGLLHKHTLVACLVITPLSNQRVKLRQMCVLSHYQGRGLGRILIEQTEAILIKDGIHEIELAARLEAEPFYQRLQYQRVGDVFTEVTIEHIKMTKSLGENPTLH